MRNNQSIVEIFFCKKSKKVLTFYADSEQTRRSLNTHSPEFYEINPLPTVIRFCYCSWSCSLRN